MRCPFCLTPDSQVRDSRPAEDAAAIRRRRHCPACGARFTTFERVQLRELTVLKKNGRREPFDRDKLARSVVTACRKRPVPDEAIDRLVSGVVRRLESTGEPEVEAQVDRRGRDGRAERRSIPSPTSASRASTAILPKPETSPPSPARSTIANDYAARAIAGRRATSAWCSTLPV